jgi:RNA polymerase sigma factor (sigma-70 family)
VDETDRQVVDRSEAGDSAAFVELFWRRGPAVHAYLARRAGRQEADDLLSEVWLRAFKGRAGLRGPDALPWLYGIARNILLAHWRQSMRPPAPVEMPDPLDPWPDTDSRVDAVAQRESIRRVLAMLPEDEREVLLLVVWEQLTPAEVALVLGLPQGTARSRLHRALSAFRSEFNPSILISSNPKEA